MSPTDDQIRDRLRALVQEPRRDFKADRMAQSFSNLTEAAVLIALRPGENGLEVLLTRRSEGLRQHPGQISFPGGRMDPEDTDLVTTALRETWEEVGIPPSDVTVFGSLLRMPMVSGYAVTAYVGEFSEGTPLIMNPGEIDELIVAPLREIADKRIHRVEQKVWNDMIFPIHYFDYGDHLVWGATGFMLHELFKYLGLR
jgi:8-oxo-dGTP pyrophosphatase MutT (NUDIX family)